MPKFKGRSTNRGNWTETEMKTAVNAVLEDKIDMREAARRYGVPKSTLYDYVKGIREGKELKFKPKLGRFTPTFPEELENALVNHIKKLDSMLMPLTKKEFLETVFKLAEAKGLSHTFNNETKQAGKHFYNYFKKRHPDITLRVPESTSLARSIGFNRKQVEIFFEKLENLVKKHNFLPHKIFNCDETGVSIVHKNQKVLSVLGKKQVGKLTSGERGRNVTILFCMGPTGIFVPPLFVFPRMRMNERLMIGAPVGGIGVAQANGWMDGTIFLHWLKHFVKHVHPTQEEPALLLLDGHVSHKDLPVLEYASEHNIHMLSLPPHTTHKLQPLDRVFMKPFKDAYNAACATWMRSNPGLRITEFDIAQLVAAAYSKVCRLDIAQNGFQCTGIFPLQPNVFADADFVTTEMTIPRRDKRDVNVPEHRVSSHASKDEQPTTSSGEHEQHRRSSDIGEPSVIHESKDEQPTTSSCANVQHPRSPDSAESSTMDILNVILPLPSTPQVGKITKRKAKTQTSEVLTSTPYKETLHKRRANQISSLRERRTARKKLKLDIKPIAAPVGNGAHKDDTETVESTSQEAGDRTVCLICREATEEDWIQCNSCGRWVHEACADICHEQYYFCDLCRSP